MKNLTRDTCSKAESQLLDLARMSQGLSGRALRKLPFLAHVKFIRVKAFFSFKILSFYSVDWVKSINANLLRGNGPSDTLWAGRSRRFEQRSKTLTKTANYKHTFRSSLFLQVNLLLVTFLTEVKIQIIEWSHVQCKNYVCRFEMNKDPILQYYALILTISSKNGQGTAFTRQYDRICKVLTKDQVCGHFFKR